MWRDKESDLNQIDGFLKVLEEFQKLKRGKWERIDEKSQMDNPPGTPGEDWIIPPDENLVAIELEKDGTYSNLKERIIIGVKRLKEIAEFLNFDEHHDFDFVNFTSPLIGNEALEGGITVARRLKKACEEHNYIFQNLVSLFQISK